MRLIGLIVLCGSAFQNVVSHDPTKMHPAPSDLATGVLTFADSIPDNLASHMVSANSVDTPKHLHEKLHHRDERQALTSSDTDLADNSLFGGDTAPKLTNIQADCVNPQVIRVSVEFDKPFQGIIYTKGHFNDETCLFTKDDNPALSYNFTIPTEGCGSLDNHADTNASITESTIIIQNDPLFQDISDVARRIRCAWSDRFDKIISSKGFKVGSLAENTMDYSADAVSVWMDIRMGKDPFQGTPVTNGVVRLGSDMTIVVYIKSKIDKGLDVVIRDCVANDAKNHQQIQLTDENGCVVQKKLMTPFTITDRVGQSGASRIAYAMLKSFKFPDSLDVNIICNIAMCKGDCGISCNGDGVKQIGVGAKKPAVVPVAATKVDSSVKRTKREADVQDIVDVIPLAKPGNVVPVETHAANVAVPPPREAGTMDDTLIGKTVFLREREPTEVILERGIRVLSDNDITEVLVNSQNRSYNILATTVRNQDMICLTRTGFGVGLAILLLIILILTILCVFFCCAACARRKSKKTRTLENSSINIYNSTDQLNRSRGTLPPSSNMSEPVSILRGSLPNLNSCSLHSGDSGDQRAMRGSAMTLPGLGIQTNPMIRHSTHSLNTTHTPEKPFHPIPLPQTPEETDEEKARSLRSINIRQRHQTVPISLSADDEATRSLRSFTVRSHHPSEQPDDGSDEAPRSLRSVTVGPHRLSEFRGTIDLDEETPRSLRSFSVRSGDSQKTMTNGGNGEAVRSLRSFTVRSHYSDDSNETASTDNGENPRSEGTLRSQSQTGLVQGIEGDEEKARSMRSVSVYRN